MTGPAKGEHALLQYTQQARHRVNFSIRWDAAEEEIVRPEMFKISKQDDEDHNDKLLKEMAESNPYTEDLNVEMGKITETFDIDLVCLIFNADGEIVDAVSPIAEEEIDRSGKIYHSGDEQHGVSTHDDEIISVELKDLPDYIHHMVFLATAQSGHDFAQVINPEARVSDAMTDNDIMLVNMGGGEAAGKTGFIFSHLYRGEEGWMLHNISEFRVDAQIEDWTAEVTPYLHS